MDAGGGAAEVRVAMNKTGNMIAMNRAVKTEMRSGAIRERRALGCVLDFCKLNLLDLACDDSWQIAEDKRRLSKKCYRDVAGLRKGDPFVRRDDRKRIALAGM